jgi:glycosyltransferase involved in cell wall biosynthesis
MRIAYLFDRPLPAKETDSEQVMKTVAALGRRGLDVSLVLPERVLPEGRAHAQKQSAPRTPAERAQELRDYYQVEGPFSVHELPNPARSPSMLGKWLYAGRALRYARELGPDLVYTRNFPTLLRAARQPLPFAYETYRPWIDQFRPLGIPFRRAMARAHFLGAVLHSEFVRARYAARGIAEARLVAVLNGYDPSLFVAPPRQHEARAKLQLPLDAKLVVYTGHINATKGLDVVLAMAKRCPELTFLLVGSDGNHLIERLGRARENVRFVPWLPFDQVVQYLFAADVLLVPPSNVPHKLIGNTVLPMKLFLYLAAARPILAGDTVDNRELLRADGPDANALLVPPGDAEGASAQLRALFDEPERARRMGKAAGQSALGLTWDHRAEKIERFLRQRLSQLVS